MTLVQTQARWLDRTLGGGEDASFWGEEAAFLARLKGDRRSQGNGVILEKIPTVPQTARQVTRHPAFRGRRRAGALSARKRLPRDIPPIQAPAQAPSQGKEKREYQQQQIDYDRESVSAVTTRHQSPRYGNTQLSTTSSSSSTALMPFPQARPNHQAAGPPPATLTVMRVMPHTNDEFGPRDQQTVNELLRDKIFQSVDTTDKIKRLLLAVNRARSMVDECTSDIKKLQDAKIIPGLNLARCRQRARQAMPRLAANRDIHSKQTEVTQAQFEIFLSQHDANGTKLDDLIDHEITELCFAITNMEGLYRYSNELSVQFNCLESQFSDYVRYIAYTIDTDKECLKHTRVTLELPEKAQKPVLTVNVEELLPLPQLLELHEWAMQSSKTFCKSTRECWHRETKKAKELYMETKLALRACARESANLKKELEEAVMLLQNQLPILAKQEKKLKGMLASKVEPLTLCKQRYQIRLQREGATDADEVQQALKDEVDHLAGLVEQLQTDLQNVRVQAQQYMEKERMLVAYIAIQIDHTRLHVELIDLEEKFYVANEFGKKLASSQRFGVSQRLNGTQLTNTHSQIPLLK